MFEPQDIRIDLTVDKPSSGMWHCGPNPSWVTVTHLPTMVQVRAYHRSQHKAREMALACVAMLVEDAGETCSFPEVLTAPRDNRDRDALNDQGVI